MRLQNGHVVVTPPQLGFAQERMNLAVADGVQQHGLASAVATGDEMVTLPSASQWTPAQGA